MPFHRGVNAECMSILLIQHIITNCVEIQLFIHKKKLSILRGCKTLHPEYDNGCDDNSSYALNLVVKIEFVFRRVKSS